MSKRNLVLAVCLWSFLQISPALACRYNVLETGFVDLGIEPYYLFCYINKDTADDIVSDLQPTLESALVDTNIRAEIINIDEQDNHPALKYLESRSTASFPAAVLASPDGQVLPVTITEPDRPLKETLLASLDRILSSPKRDEICRKAAETYGVVLIIEGPDAQENNTAKQAASSVIKLIAEQMDMMPKPITKPPVVVTMSTQSLSSEKILLWSLDDLKAEDVNKPHAAVLYGRARWIGPLFKGEEISEDNLANVLFVIGADCECGYDYRWLQGTMLPAKWEQDLQALAAESLGFDPENPMIKMEIASIVRRGYPYYPGVPFGYQEVVVESESVQHIERASPNEAMIVSPPSPNMVARTVEPAFPEDGYSPFRTAVFVLVGLGILVVLGGVAVLARAKTA